MEAGPTPELLSSSDNDDKDGLKIEMIHFIKKCLQFHIGICFGNIFEGFKLIL